MKPFSYEEKEAIMRAVFANHQSPGGFRSVYKAIPIDNYETIKRFIDFTKYYVMFRGPRPRIGQSSTRKRDAHSFDVYKRDPLTVNHIRIEREAFLRGVAYGQAYDRMIRTI
jgi:hypothetical protein